ncbi:hypothetical protein [Mucilaginibacter terrae]|uniref:Uncharacterized protein n=1 Tax=Mucilaginibacter terrae TaxID=1955052 RepID=A0ABU3GR84_9SPHI|nr:hypothetical protein [Mucilaginibacter terrae]MDT3402294.1 hypothetical protein [Mucilaginibacter terrae]
MEKLALNLQSQPAIDSYVAGNHLMKYEKDLLSEILISVNAGDYVKMNWFNSFGDSLRQIIMNVYEHRKALEFGFTEIAFNQYGWFSSPKFIDREDIQLEQSEIRLGHGPNGLWAYALSCNYGTAGSSSPLCVFCKKYASRDAALTDALAEMKAQMTKYLGNADTTNYKQEILNKTLNAIAAMKNSRVQLSLF